MHSKTIEIRFYEELNDFLPLEKRKVSFFHTVLGNVSIKDVIESLGVPHAEIDLIIVNNESVDFNYQLKDNDKVSVYPTFEALDITPIIRLRPKPLRHPQFILDVHLGRLAKYMRLLGFDSLYANHYSDEEIVKIAKEEGRVILTRDVDLLKSKMVTHGRWVRNTDPHKQIKEIISQLALETHIAPFTRCLDCNGILKPVEKALIEKDLEEDTKKYYQDFYQCSVCQKIYWKGSHYEKMVDLIKELRA